MENRGKKEATIETITPRHEIILLTLSWSDELHSSSIWELLTEDIIADLCYEREFTCVSIVSHRRRKNAARLNFLVPPTF